MAYIGQRPVIGRYIKLDQISSGFNGSNTGFSMTAGSQAVFPGTARNLLLSLGGVIQEPDTDFTISGSTLTFTTPPVANTTFFGVIYGDMQATGTPSDGTVLPASIASSGNFSFPQLTVTSSASLLGGVVFNENGADVNFRVEGDTDTNLLVVDASSNNIGVGTASPDHKLQVVGSSAITNTGATLAVDDNASLAANIGGTIALRGTDGTSVRTLGLIKGGKNNNSNGSFDGYLAFHTRTNGIATTEEHMRITSGGNVGIGTDSPSDELTLRGAQFQTTQISIGDNGDRLRIGYVHSDALASSTAASQIVSTAGSDLFIAPASNAASEIHFFSNASSGAPTERMRLDSVGRVGIGVTSFSDTASALTIKNMHSGSEHTILEIICDDNETARVEFSETSTSRNGSIRYIFTSDQRAMTFHTDGSGASGERMRITSGGNVGIGTTGPNQLLEVANSSGGATISISTDEQPGSQASKKYMNLDFTGYNNLVMAKVQSWDESSSTGAGHLTFHTLKHNVGVAERMRIDDDGRIMINSTAVTNTHDQLTVKRVAASFGEMSLTVDANTTTDSAANAFLFAKSKHTYWAGYGFQNSDGHIGAIVGRRDASASDANTEIRVEIGGTHINQSEDRTWNFKKTGDLSISDGNLIVANGHGIDFSATGNGGSSPTGVSELFNDYEVGTFTVTLANSLTVGTQTKLTYTKIGNKCHISGQFRIGTGGSDLTINNLPFTSVNTGSTDETFSVGIVGLYNVDMPSDGGASGEILTKTQKNDNNIFFVYNRDNSDPNSHTATANGYYTISHWYTVST